MRILTFREFIADSADKPIINEDENIPQIILSFAKKKGPNSVELIKTVSSWLKKAGKKISGGAAIGKNYDTIVLDMRYQGSEIYIDTNKEEIKLFDKVVSDYESFKKVLDKNT